ncbi:transposable element Tcb1 transposase [Trichonephila clavipes]|nr:transposable element Tcb1 transposase [Trichonephila clavipes]
MNLCDKHLLNKGLHGKTQNANESFNGIWGKLIPKDIFVELQTLRLEAHMAVIQFNKGFRGLLDVLNQAQVQVGANTERGFAQFDEECVSESKRHSLSERKDSDLPRDCGLSFREIRSRVGRNQTTVMRICDCWMQEGTAKRRGRSHPPQCTTSREDRQIVRMEVTHRSVTSRTVAQHIESVTHHSVSARTIRRRLQLSGLAARRLLLGLLLTPNYRRLRRQWCHERRTWAAE